MWRWVSAGDAGRGGCSHAAMHLPSSSLVGGALPEVGGVLNGCITQADALHAAALESLQGIRCTSKQLNQMGPASTHIGSVRAHQSSIQ